MKNVTTKNLFLVRKEIKELFIKHGITDDSDADFLIASVLNKNRAEIKVIEKITEKDYIKILKFANQRIKGKPISKIFNFAEFYGYRFYINNFVLSPRMETEILVEKCLEIISKGKKTNVLDLCCGSGCIGISIKKQNPNINVTLSDISQRAINVATKNSNVLNAKVKIIKSDLFNKINDKFDLIVSNPPYIEKDECKKLDIEVKKYDPKLALDGGKDGLNFYKKIIDKSPMYLNKNGIIAFEFGIGQANKIKKLLQKDFENITIYKDYNNIERIIIATKKEIV